MTDSDHDGPCAPAQGASGRRTGVDAWCSDPPEILEALRSRGGDYRLAEPIIEPGSKPVPASRIMVMVERPADWRADRTWTDLDARLTAPIGSPCTPTMAVGDEQVPLGGEYIVTEVRIVEDGRRLMVVAQR